MKKYALDFHLWDERRDYKYIINRIWVYGFWTPVVIKQLRMASKL